MCLKSSMCIIGTRAPTCHLNYKNNIDHINKHRRDYCVQLSEHVADSQGNPLKFQRAGNILRRLVDPSVIATPIHMYNEISDGTTRKMIEPFP